MDRWKEEVRVDCGLVGPELSELMNIRFPIQQGGLDVLTSINTKLDALLSNSKKSQSGSQAQQIEYNNNVFSFQEIAVVYNEEDILPLKRHGAIVKKAVVKMTTNILKDKKRFNDEIGDENAVVQNYLSVFLNDIHVVANIIICGGDSKATSSSSAELPQSKVKIE